MASAITSSVVATLSKAPSAASLAVIQAARAQRVTITEFRNRIAPVKGAAATAVAASLVPAAQLGASYPANLPQSFRPIFVNGHWRKPYHSKRKIALLRKTTLLAGGEWPFEAPVKPKRPVVLKGHKFDRLKIERLKKIEENMKNMPAKIAEYRKTVAERRVKLDTISALTKGLSGIAKDKGAAADVAKAKK